MIHCLRKPYLDFQPQERKVWPCWLQGTIILLFLSSWTFKKYCKNCHTQCATATTMNDRILQFTTHTTLDFNIYTAFRQIPHQSRICTRTIICHRKEQNSKLFCPQVITCLYSYPITLMIQVKPKIFTAYITS